MIIYATELRLFMRRWRPCGLLYADAPGLFFRHGNPQLFQRHGFWLRIDITTALRGYGLLAQVRGLVCFSAVMSRVYTLYSLKDNQAIHVAQPSRVFF